MWFGRFGVIVPVLAMAGALAAKKRIAVTAAPCPPTARCSSCC
jgi:K+-transporting ATPase ATPase A chain